MSYRGYEVWVVHRMRKECFLTTEKDIALHGPGSRQIWRFRRHLFQSSFGLLAGIAGKKLLVYATFIHLFPILLTYLTDLVE